MTAGGATADRDAVGSSRGVIASVVLCALLLLGLRWVLVGDLQSIYFLSGWVLFGFVSSLAVVWWLPKSQAGLENRIEKQLAWSLALVVAFAIHTNFRMPGGFLDLLLTGWLALTIVSLFVGRFLLTARWLQCHVVISYGLAAACLFHGIHVHAHGLFAHWLLDH